MDLSSPEEGSDKAWSELGEDHSPLSHEKQVMSNVIEEQDNNNDTVEFEYQEDNLENGGSSLLPDEVDDDSCSHAFKSTSAGTSPSWKKGAYLQLEPHILNDAGHEISSIGYASNSVKDEAGYDDPTESCDPGKLQTSDNEFNHKVPECFYKPDVPDSDYASTDPGNGLINHRNVASLNSNENMKEDYENLSNSHREPEMQEESYAPEVEISACKGNEQGNSDRRSPYGRLSQSGSPIADRDLRDSSGGARSIQGSDGKEDISCPKMYYTKLEDSPRSLSPEPSPSIEQHRKRALSPEHVSSPRKQYSPRKRSAPSPRRRDYLSRRQDSPTARRDSPRRKDRKTSQSPIRRRDFSGHRRSHRRRSRSRSRVRDRRNRSPPRRDHSPRRRSSPNYRAGRPPRRPWSPPPNRNTGIGKPGRNLFVAGFSFVITETDLEKKFSRYGRIRGVRIVKDKRSGESRGYGFVSYEKDEDADEAIRALDQTEWHGRIVLVEKSKPPLS